MNILKRYAVGFSYIGENYCGYQSQGCGRAVADALTLSISTVANHEVKLGCAGRTDAGVHALLQVVHFDSCSNRTEYQWLKGINANLPSDIKVLWVQEVEDRFHARFSAQSRSYVYILNPEQDDLFMERYSWKVGSLDLSAMQHAANILLGEHDFYAFQSRHCQAKHAIRRIDRVLIKEVGYMVHFEITANAFVHHMVRKIVATLVKVGEGKMSADEVLFILKNKNRRKVPGQAPAKGLFLRTVAYPDCYGLPLEERNHLIGG